MQDRRMCLNFCLAVFVSFFLVNNWNECTEELHCERQNAVSLCIQCSVLTLLPVFARSSERARPPSRWARR